MAEAGIAKSAELLAEGGERDPKEPGRIEEVCARYVVALEAELMMSAARTRLLPGVGPLLARLEGEPGVVLGLLTGNVARGAELKLRAAGLEPSRFRLGAFGSDSAHRPDLPAVAAGRAHAWFGRAPHGEEVVIIGDTPADVTCGEAIGARGIGVATGSYGVDDLRSAGARAAFETLEPLDLVVDAILA